MGHQLCTILFFVSLFIVVPVIVESRQMCWSCQFVLNGAGKEECSAAPGNWSGGESRIKCPSMCIITAEFDAVTGEPTFIHRGCGVFDQKDGCLENGARHSCFFSCNSKNYCNDKKLKKSPLLAVSDLAENRSPCVLCLLSSLLVFILVEIVYYH